MHSWLYIYIYSKCMVGIHVFFLINSRQGWSNNWGGLI
jgi:hypothetical protein